MGLLPVHKTIEQRLNETYGITTGWDYMRLSLAIGVMLAHSVTIVGGWHAYLHINPYVNKIFLSYLLPMFFCLSGFLVARSLENVSLPVFLGLRFLRIFPALCMELLLSAFILGLIVTKFDLITYFSHPEFYKYFLNLIGWIHFSLPGTFETNPLGNLVNGSLWTVPYELECYIGLSILALARIPGRWPLMLSALLIFTAYNFYFDTAAKLQTIDGRMLVTYFLAGVTFYSMRKIIPLNFPLFCIATLLTGWLFLTPLFYETHFYYFCAIPLAYTTVWLGLRNPPKAPIIFSGDFSYGIYLYAFVIQQTVAYFTKDTILFVWYGNFTISLVLVFCFAAFSWFYVEKPVLKIKKILLKGRLDVRERDFLKESKAGITFPIDSPKALADRAGG